LLREGLLRVVLAVVVAVLLAGERVPVTEPVAYAAAGLAVVYGGLVAVGRPAAIFRDGLVLVLLDAVLVSLLVAGTGGAESPLYPLYLLAALGVARVPDHRRAVVGTCALGGGYLVAAWIGMREAYMLLGPTLVAQTALILLFCAIAGVLAVRLRGARESMETLSAALETERVYRARMAAAISKLGPVLSAVDLERLLSWAADTAREVTGATYAHVSMIDGRHRTAVEGDLDAYPSWWHPTIQRLVLHASRTTEVQRTDEAIHGVKGFLAVPLVSDDGTGPGAIVVGGGDLGVEEEHLLVLLAAELAPALREAGNAPDGRDDLTGLPNHGSLLRVLKRRLAYEGPLTILAVRLDRLEHRREESVGRDERTVLRVLGRELSRAHRWVFYLGEGRFVVLLRGASQARARRIASSVRHLAEKAAAEQVAPLTALVGYVIADATHEEPELLVQAALEATHNGVDASFRGERVVEAGETGLSTLARITLALVAAAETHSPLLGDHLRAVSRTAHLIGMGMGLTQDRLDTLVAGALLHDVGKIGIPNSVLQKSGPLSQKERWLIYQHPVMGANLVGAIEGLEGVLPAVKHHHERFDGQGYPDGLKGEAIPLEARIVLVADAFESMIGGRPYRSRRSYEDALGELERHSGTQFDPEVVGALMAVLKTDADLADFAT
jgi:HD-GYP domain-containing protein (c-di-GMP phosphodiesterase class II)